MARNRLDLDLISGVDFGLDRSDLTLRAGWRRLTPVTSSAAARFRSSPEFTHLALQGSVWDGVWLWTMPVARVIHWEWLRGLSMAGAGFSGDEAALWRRNPPACASRQLKERRGLQELAQKGKRGVLMLTVGEISSHSFMKTSPEVSDELRTMIRDNFLRNTI